VTRALVVLVLWSAPVVVLAQTEEVETNDRETADAYESALRYESVGEHVSTGPSDHAGTGRYESRWEWGPWPEHIGISLGCFAAVYVVQLISSAVSTAQGEHDIGLEYSASQLADYRNWAYLPFVGPWAKIGLAPPHVDDEGVLLFAFEGVLELASLAFFVVSLFGHQRDDWTSAQAGSWRITPRATGISFDLRF
jgi:hypothetical protein